MGSCEWSYQRSSMRLVLILAILFFSGCADYHYPKIRETEYKGHHYLIFKVNGNYGQTYVHDPDCKCYGKKPENE
jgi:hypothetical protein